MPDFIQIAKGYGLEGIRVTKPEEVDPALRVAMKNRRRATIIEFAIDPEELVYPMIQPNGTLTDMLMDS
jgi:acetolactate synthase-1/2/3 large subunit